jgi:hypothetical protein
MAGGVAAGVGALDGQVRLLDLDGLAIAARADLDGVAGVGGVDRGLDGAEGAAVVLAVAAAAVRVLVDDQDAPMPTMGPGGARRDHVQADGGDDREQQHCSTSLHGPKPPE